MARYCSRNVLLTLRRQLQVNPNLTAARISTPSSPPSPFARTIAMRMPARTYSYASGNVGESQKLFEQQRRDSNSPSDFVKIVEVGPRDGLQNEKEIVPTKTKIELIER